MNVAHELERALRPVVGGDLPVHLTAWDGSTAGPVDAPRVVLTSPRALRRMLWNPGELGAAQAYVTEDLDVNGDLVAALDHVWDVARRRGLGGVRPGPVTLARAVAVAARVGALGPRLPNPSSQAHIRGRRHSRRRDRKVISHHYDLTHEFYGLILDSRMAYSSAYFTVHPEVSPQAVDGELEDAQRDKLDLVCRKVGLEPGMRFLDIGCGWGALSLHAATEYGARVVGVTLSREQKQYADARIAALGLDSTVEIRVQDYREISGGDLLADGGFDAVASLEMGEHVGEKNYPRYARTLFDAARPGARVLIQQMCRTGRHRGGGPFIEAFIAPDMTMRPTEETVDLLTDGGLEPVDVEPMREHYVRTVDGWLANFERNYDRIVDLVGVETARVWRLYLVGGRASFAQGRMGVDQILLRRPEVAS